MVDRLGSPEQAPRLVILGLWDNVLGTWGTFVLGCLLEPPAPSELAGLMAFASQLCLEVAAAVYDGCCEHYLLQGDFGVGTLEQILLDLVFCLPSAVGVVHPDCACRLFSPPTLAELQYLHREQVVPGLGPTFLPGRVMGLGLQESGNGLEFLEAGAVCCAAPAIRAVFNQQFLGQS